MARFNAAWARLLGRGAPLPLIVRVDMTFLLRLINPNRGLTVLLYTVRRVVGDFPHRN